MTQPESKLKLDPTNPADFFNLKIFFRTALFCGLLYVLMMLWLERVKPPEGYVFETLPPITGTWKSEQFGAGRSSGTSFKVGDTSVHCSIAGYYPRPFGASSSGRCNPLRIPNGETVTAHRVKVSWMLGKEIYLATIYSASKTYQIEDDRKLREIWIRDARQSASGLAIDLMIILYCTQMGMLAHSISKGNKK
jgi:hypothetical protein